MKQILFLTFLLLLSVSCKKRPKNGDLDGFWQLQQLVEFASSATEANDTLYPKKQYLSFQLDLMSLQSPQGTCLGRFDHTGDSLFINMLEGDLQFMKQYGASTLSPRYKVVRLNSDRMVLRSGESELSFRKW